MSDQQTETMEDEQLTETAKTRWEWLSTLTAAALVATFLGIMIALVWTPIPASWPGGLPGYLFLAAFAAAVTYAIGEDVTSIVNDLHGSS